MGGKNVLNMLSVHRTFSQMINISSPKQGIKHIRCLNKFSSNNKYKFLVRFVILSHSSKWIGTT